VATFEESTIQKNKMRSVSGPLRSGVKKRLVVKSWNPLGRDKIARAINTPYRSRWLESEKLIGNWSNQIAMT
jgi:hypothetical protein